MEEKYKLNDKYTILTIAGETVLMPKDDFLKSENPPAVLNDVSAFIAGCIAKEPRSKEEILKIVKSEYDVAENEAMTGIESVLKFLKNSDAI